MPLSAVPVFMAGVRQRGQERRHRPSMATRVPRGFARLTCFQVTYYAGHPDFPQTNTIEKMIDQGTGEVTESLKNRVIMPLTGSYQATDHVLGHELVHAFQYDIAG